MPSCYQERNFHVELDLVDMEGSHYMLFSQLKVAGYVEIVAGHFRIQKGWKTLPPTL